MNTDAHRLIAFLACAIACAGAYGGDWPQFRYDAQRSAATSEQLPPELSLHWVRVLPPPRPAFPLEARLLYDASYDPVVMGNTMFVPSMLTDSVSALDTETGAERWRFFAEGPVRFAPSAWEGSVYFTSDDGHVYCLDASDGELRWKFRGLPADSPDRKILGHGRLISHWPARGGVVIDEHGTLYFAAGLWPAEGVFLYALDARTGAVRWANTDSGLIPEANMDHGIANYAGLTPQGYLALLDGKLVVPCGAQLPAFLDPKSGKLDDYMMGWGGRIGMPKGSWFVAGHGSYLSHSGDLYDMRLGNEEAFDDPNRPVDYKSELYAGGFARLLIDPANQKELGVFGQPVFSDGVMYAKELGLAAFRLASPAVEERNEVNRPEHRAKDHFPDKLLTTFPELWRMPGESDVHIKAGTRLYLGAAGVVQALECEGNAPELAWQASIEGTPHRMLAAGGKLFVVTVEGSIYAFGAARAAAPTVHALEQRPLPDQRDSWSAKAKEILDTSGVSEGYALVLGLVEGRLVEELLRQSELTVIAVDPDAGKTDRLRRRLFEAGLYGIRAEAHVGNPGRFPFPPYMASLVLSENPGLLDFEDSGELARAVFHPLRPYGGTACLATEDIGDTGPIAELADGVLDGLTLRASGDWTLLARSGPLPNAANWSHIDGDAANAGASEDAFVEAPLGMLWFDASRRWKKQVGQEGSAAVVVAEGRVILKSDSLLAVDAYTGRHMWETDLPFAHTGEGQIVAMDDAIYVSEGKTCLVFDPATGEQTSTLRLPEQMGEPWSSLRAMGKYLVARSGEFVICMDRHEGRTLWEFKCGRSELSIALGEDRVFVSELVNERRGEPMEATSAWALDLETGEVRWRIAGGTPIRYARALDLLIFSTGVHRGQDGSPVSTLPGASGAGREREDAIAVVGERLLWGSKEKFVTLDLTSGEQVGEETKWVLRGCTGMRASSNLVTTRYRANAAFFDLSSREVTRLWNIRPACSNNLFPADGLLNLPSLTGGCTCNYSPVAQAYAPMAAIQYPAQQ